MAAPSALEFLRKPQNGKWLFTHREPLSWALCAIMFALVASVASLLLPGSWVLLVDVIAGLVLLYMHFFVWARLVITIRCPHCQKLLRTNTPWVCGLHQCKNEQPDEFPFVHKCQHCGTEPKAYKCHHQSCRKIIFLTDDESSMDFAFRLSQSGPKPDKRSRKLKGVVETIEDKRHEIAIAELDAKLNEIYNRIAGPRFKSPLQQKTAAFDRYLEGAVGLRAHAQKRLAEIPEEIRNDPKALEDFETAVELALRKYDS